MLISGNPLDAGKLTRAIGIRPTHTWKRGEQIGASMIKYREDGWMLDTPFSETIDAQKVVVRLLKKLKPKLQRLKKALAKFELECNLQIHIYHSQRDPYPILYFHPELLEQFARLGAGLDIDIMPIP